MIKTGIDHTKIAFIDIETVHGYSDIFDLPLSMATAWANVCESKYKDEYSDTVSVGTLYKKYAALYPEFGKIICISIGVFKNETEFTVKAYYSTDERELLINVGNALTQLSSKYRTIGGHNILGFDIDYMIRRSVINGVNLPSSFDLYGIKPWDLKDRFIDTMVMWKGLSTYLGSCSLESISAAFGIPSPKEEMNGSKVSEYFYLPTGPDFKKIGIYCNRDVYSCARCYLRMTKGNDAMKVENII